MIQIVKRFPRERRNMTALSVNLNKIALVRNSRGRNFPDVTEFGRMALEAGVAGLTIHPRPDQRHATYDDVRDLKSLIDDFPGRELNIEGYPTEGFMRVVLEHCPHQCTLVPDGPDQVTSDHGWDLDASRSLLEPTVQALTAKGIRTSVFVDHEPANYDTARELGIDRVELYTEPYAIAHGNADADAVLGAFARAAAAAQSIGLGVNAGHDLNLANLADFLSIDGVLEVSIGHALTVDALQIGFIPAVGAYLAITNA
jgi:pyridoxine 5-phosphate synthase